MAEHPFARWSIETREDLERAWRAATPSAQGDLRQAINRAYDAGRQRGGLPCCGTTGAEHAPWCAESVR